MHDMPFKRRKQVEPEWKHELAEANKILSLLGAIDTLALESHAPLKLICERLTETIAQATNYDFAGLLTRSSRYSGELRLDGWTGGEWLGRDATLNFSRPVHVALDHKWFSADLDRTCLISIGDFTLKQLAGFLGCKEAEVGHIKQQLPLKSIYVVKLTARRRLIGLLVVGFLNPIVEMKQNDKQLIDRLSETIGITIDNKLLFEENQRALRQLKESNAKLKALDEAKDDFISMASHQLRTPLTSVKGYISMVLEGDSGKITPTQKQMLSQAFFSSQRMVYLIADLLNVSRLRTGKFTIEPSPVDLAQMVGEEIEQLIDIAKSRNLELQYDKPKRFSMLMLDEIKIRQVIMNFIDNAIYYTPAGGHIAVKLIEKPSSIELRVEDDGIGVPKSEQPHLFTKFYRAGNARKARPDGTGLGLFMAKKVIVGQGGAIIFESKEGKGSTFGFSLNKHKLATNQTA